MRVRAWILLVVLAAAALVVVIALTTRDEAASAEVTEAAVAQRESENEANALTPPWSSSSLASTDVIEPLTHVVAKSETTTAAINRPSTRGNILVQLRTSHEPRPKWPVSVTACTDSNPSQTVRRLAWLTDDTVLVDDVWPGPVELRVECEWCAPFQTSLEVRAAERATVTVDLDCPLPSGRVDVTVRSQTGAFHEPIFVSCVDSTGARHRLGDVAWGGEGGARIGLFLSDSLPGGEFEFVFDTSTEFGIAPGDRVSARAGGSIELVVLDRAPRVDIGFRVFDAESGVELDEFDAQWGRLNWGAGHPGIRTGEIAITGWSERAPLEWQISKRDYACATGTLAAASVTEEGSTRWIRVELRRGRFLRVGAQDCSAAAIANATVLADGIEIGRTDKSGCFETFLTVAPRLVEVRYLDWTRCTNVSSATGRLERLAPCGFLNFFLRRPE